MEKQYRTESIQTAAFLLSTGAPYVGCERSGMTRCDFVFLDPDGTMRERANSYFNGATVIARRFYKNLGDLRTEITETMKAGDLSSRSLADLKHKRDYGYWPEETNGTQGNKGVQR